MAQPPHHRRLPSAALPNALMPKPTIEDQVSTIIYDLKHDIAEAQLIDPKTLRGTDRLNIEKLVNTLTSINHSGTPHGLLQKGTVSLLLRINPDEAHLIENAHDIQEAPRTADGARAYNQMFYNILSQAMERSEVKDVTLQLWRQDPPGHTADCWISFTAPAAKRDKISLLHSGLQHITMPNLLDRTDKSGFPIL